MDARALSPSEASTWTRLAAVLELLPSAIDHRLVESTGFTRFEFAVLETLAGADDERMRMTALAAATNATLPRLSRVVTRLEADGVVIKAACEGDGRAVNAQLTDLGRERLAASRADHVAAIRDLLLTALDDTEVAQLGAISAKALTALDPDGRFAITRACATGGDER